MRTKMKWSPGRGVKVLGVALTNDESWVVSAAGPAFGICPDCGRRTRYRHGWSNRSLQGLPVQGKTVTVKLRLSRWRCAHQKCERQTFTDRLPTIASPYARRTRRVSEIVGLLGHSAGGRPGGSAYTHWFRPQIPKLIVECSSAISIHKDLGPPSAVRPAIAGRLQMVFHVEGAVFRALSAMVCGARRDQRRSGSSAPPPPSGCARSSSCRCCGHAP